VDAVRARPGDGRPYVRGALAVDDRQWTDVVEARAVEEPRLVVAGRVAADDATGDALRELAEVGRRALLGEAPRQEARPERETTPSLEELAAIEPRVGAAGRLPSLELLTQ
jgi:hypothetical protein